MLTQRIILKVGVLLLTLFCFMPASGQSVDRQLQEANNSFQEGKTEEARQRYEAIVAQDSSSYEALSWLGNYYYLKGKGEWTTLDQTFKEVHEPSRMQVARHRDAMKAIYTNWYSKAEACFLKALDVRKNEHLQMLLVDIDQYKTRLGMIKAVEPGRRRLNK